MTIANFQRYLTSIGCEYEPLSGTNITGTALKISNPHNQRKHFLTVHKGGELSETTIIQTCDKLLIKYPPHLSHLIE